MLADRKRPQDIVRLISKSPFPSPFFFFNLIFSFPPSSLCRDRYALEPKYDGERIHLHKDGSEYKLFSRNANDVTELYLSHLMPNLHLITATR